MNNDVPVEISLTDFVDEIVRRKFTIALCVAVALLLAVTYLHLADREHSVALKVTPTASAVSTLPGGLSGLASIAGISLPGQLESNPFELYLDQVRSRETAAAIVENQILMRELFPEEWDDEQNSWIEPGGLVRGLIRFVKTVLGASPPAWVPPDARRVHEFLEDEVSVVRDRNGPIVRLVMTAKQLEMARGLLAEIHHVVDSSLRRKELERSTSYVEYLKLQLANVSITEYRQALNEIIAEQEKRRMVASSNLPFAAEPVGRPTESVRPVSPRPALVLILSVLLGALSGILIAISGLQWNKGRREPS